MLVLAIAFGLAAATVFAVTAVAQQQEVAAAGTGGRSFLRDLVARPRWWVATVGVGVGYALQAAALGTGPILVVQPLLIVALVLALPLGARWNHRAVRRRDITWAALITIAVGVFLVVGNPSLGTATAGFDRWAAPVVGCGAIVIVAGGVAATAPARWRSLSLAVIAGTLFGLASVLTKSMVHHFGDGLPAGIEAWETWALVAAGALGFAAQQLAFQAGSLEISLPAVTVLDPVVSVVVALTALGERIRVHGLGWALISLSVGVMVAGTVILARAGIPTAGPAGPTAGPTAGPAASREPARTERTDPSRLG